ncbi:DUF3299 domain-containing protein [Chloracidobacterium aggregatum]|uniref:DUF3299 domain-containing protein n=1 Tax=Chloracidobacterium aggregatum TaxID=2851959 RepID=UPI001B8AC84E|nr:DUF3299 domain-containing protein [Chloracidobacterium aggregatum]QUV97811.1 DUF3299 domain-containing protein [Chloracidobacterium sp. E]
MLWHRWVPDAPGFFYSVVVEIEVIVMQVKSRVKTLLAVLWLLVVAVSHSGAGTPAPTALRFRDLDGVQVNGREVVFPARAQQLNGKQVEVNGFMVPLGISDGKIRRFILIEVPLACCFGDGPGIEQMIFVTLAPGQELSAASDYPVAVSGTLQVGVQRRESGAVESLYRIVNARARKLV